MRKFVVIATAAAVLGTASLAHAEGLGQPCTKAPKDRWLTMDVLQKKVEEVGFKVKRAKLKDTCAEFYVITKPGTPLELFVDPATGTIVGGI